MSSMYHGGDEFLPVGYGGAWEATKAWVYTYVPVVNIVAPIFSRENLPCLIAFGNKLRKMEGEAATGDRVAKKIYEQIRKREKQVMKAEGGLKSQEYKDFCKWVDGAFVQWEAGVRKKEAAKAERDLATVTTTYDPYDPMTGGFAPAGVRGGGVAPADAQTVSTTGGETAGGVSTTMLLALGAGAVLLFALSRKSASAPASPYKGF
jgi:hypothetical protein